jgi:hypothetical protein
MYPPREKRRIGGPIRPYNNATILLLPLNQYRSTPLSRTLSPYSELP